MFVLGRSSWCAVYFIEVVKFDQSPAMLRNVNKLAEFSVPLFRAILIIEILD